MALKGRGNWVLWKVIYFTPSLSHKSIKTTQYFNQLKKQQKTQGQCRNSYLSMRYGFFPVDTWSRKGECWFLMNCKKLFSRWHLVSKCPSYGPSLDIDVCCLGGQNPTHRPSSSIFTVTLWARPPPSPSQTMAFALSWVSLASTCDPSTHRPHDSQSNLLKNMN